MQHIQNWKCFCKCSRSMYFRKGILWKSGEWPCELRRCSYNWKVLDLNPPRHLAGVMNSTLSRGSW